MGGPFFFYVGVYVGVRRSVRGWVGTECSEVEMGDPYTPWLHVGGIQSD